MSFSYYLNPNRSNWVAVLKTKRSKLRVYQRQTGLFDYDYHCFTVAGRDGPTLADEMAYVTSFGAARAALNGMIAKDDEAKVKAAADKAAKAEERRVKAEQREADAKSKADAVKAKAQKPDPIALLRSEMQAEMQAAIAKGIADALAAMQATAPAKPRKDARKQAAAS